MSLKSYRFLVVSGLLLTSIASFSYAQGNNTAQSMQNIKQAQGTLDKMVKAVDAIDARKKRKVQPRTQRNIRLPLRRTPSVARPKQPKQPNPPKPKP